MWYICDSQTCCLQLVCVYVELCMDKPLGKSIVIVGYVLTFVFGDKFLLSSCSRLGTLYYKYDRKVLRMLPPFLASSPSAILEK